MVVRRIKHHELHVYEPTYKFCYVVNAADRGPS